LENYIANLFHRNNDASPEKGKLNQDKVCIRSETTAVKRVVRWRIMGIKKIMIVIQGGELCCIISCG
jgi:hypothetical protein